MIDEGPFKCRNSNIIATILEACEVPLYDRMILPCTYYHNIAGGMHPKYFGKNVGEFVAKAALKYAASEGAKYFIGVNTSDASMKLESKMVSYFLLLWILNPTHKHGHFRN